MGEVLGSAHLFIGSIDGLAEKFRDLRARLGISSIMVGEIDELAPVVERLAGTEPLRDLRPTPAPGAR